MPEVVEYFRELRPKLPVVVMLRRYS